MNNKGNTKGKAALEQGETSRFNGEHFLSTGGKMTTQEMIDQLAAIKKQSLQEKEILLSEDNQLAPAIKQKYLENLDHYGPKSRFLRDPKWNKEIEKGLKENAQAEDHEKMSRLVTESKASASSFSGQQYRLREQFKNQFNLYEIDKMLEKNSKGGLKKPWM